MFDFALASYASCLAKGRTLWTKLGTGLARYIVDPAGLGTELTRRRQGYDARWREHYASRVLPGRGGPQTVATAGGRSTDDAKTALDGGRDLPYSNDVDLANNRIRANANWGNKDRAEERLPNSEILWHQYRERAEASFRYRVEDRTAAKMAALETIERYLVTNNTTYQVAWMGSPDDKPWVGGRAWTFGPDREEFFALLGTPNVAAAVHLLIDHMDELGGKTIDRLTVSTDEKKGLSIEIHLGPADMRFFDRSMVIGAQFAATTTYL